MSVSPKPQRNEEALPKANRGATQQSVPVERWMGWIGLIGGVLALVSLALAFLFDALKLGLYSLCALCLGQSVLFFWLRHSLDQQGVQLAQRYTRLNEQLRESAAQEERNRLARDLHDTIKQQLFSINMMAATAQSVQGQEKRQATGEYLQEVRTLAQAALTEMKALLTQLRPHSLDNIGLREAIREQLEALHFRAEVSIELQCTELPDTERLPLGAQEALFRAVQESLSNIARHARASQVTVRLTHDEQQMQIEIVDDGQGFDPQKVTTGMGLANVTTRLRELGGSATIASVVGQGSTVRLLLPLFRQRPLVDEKLVEQRYRLAWGIRSAAALAAISATYLSFERAVTLWVTLSTLLLLGSLVVLVYGWRQLQPLLPVSYQPWTLWADLGSTVGIAISLASLEGILPEQAWLGVAGWLLLLLVSLAILFGRRWAVRHTLYEWTTLKMEQTRMQNIKWMVLFSLMYTPFAFNFRYPPPLTSWRLTNIHEIRYMGSWLVAAAVLAIIARQNQQWLLENYAAAERLQPTAPALLPQTAQPQPATPAQVKVMRWTTRLLMGGYLYLGIGLVWDSFTGHLARNDKAVVGFILISIFTLASKLYYEVQLTRQCAVWTRLGEQRAATNRYRKMAIILSLVLLAGGIVIAPYSRFFATLPANSELISIMLFLLVGSISAVAYLWMMVYFSVQRVRFLRSQSTAAETAAERDEGALYATIKQNWPVDDPPSNFEEHDEGAF